VQKEPKKLTYKLASGAGAKNLQQLLTNALKKYTKPDKRLEELGAHGSEVRFVAYGRNSHQALIGVFHKLTPGRAQEVIEMVKDGDEWPVHLVTAKTPGKEAREFVEGTLFFAIWKNHVVLNQARACSADMFQEHLSWLLSLEEAKKDGGVPKATIVSLNDPVPPSARKKSQMPVKKIDFGGAAVTTKAVPASLAKKADISFTPSGRIWKALLDILVELKADVPPELLLSEALTHDDLTVSLQLVCSKKNADSAAGKVLGALGKSLSHSNAPYKLTLADNTEIFSDTMKVGKIFSVECSDHHPVHESIFRCMIDYMGSLVTEEIIVETEPFGNAK